MVKYAKGDWNTSIMNAQRQNMQDCGREKCGGRDIRLQDALINKNRLKKIKVVALIWDMGNGGAQQVLINNLRFFKEDKDIDFKVISFCPPCHSKNDEIIINENLNVEYLCYPKSRIKIPIIRYPFNKVVEIQSWYQVLRREKPDIVHVHISELLMTTLLPIIKSNIHVKFDTLHSDPYRYKGLQLFVIRRAFRNNGFIPICLNDRQVQRAISHYGINRYEIVRNGIDIKKFKSDIIIKNEARKKIGVGNDAFLLAGVGRLDPIKNYELMLQILKNIRTKKENVHLVIAGGGDQTKLKKFAKLNGIEKSVTFLGQVNDVAVVYCAADVLLMTSYSESSSLTLIEAQICGARCVISDGIPDESVITEKVNKMPKGASVDEWVNTILFGGNEIKAVLSETDYELASTNDKLKQVYLKYYMR